jgi:hypothetical protein
MICLSCGQQLSPELTALASLRCEDCRDSRAPIDRVLLEGGDPHGDSRGRAAAGRASVVRIHGVARRYTPFA